MRKKKKAAKKAVETPTPDQIENANKAMALVNDANGGVAPVTAAPVTDVGAFDQLSNGPGSVTAGAVNSDAINERYKEMEGNPNRDFLG